MQKQNQKLPLIVRTRIKIKEQKRLMTAHLRYVDRLISNNAPTSTYHCPDCQFPTVTLIPKHHQVEPSKPYFDTATTCPNCGVILFLKKYADGTVVVNHISNLMS